ncbi:type I restriction-modification system subunit M [Agrobacterium leguminum]|uniref:type I restriction-modification system subunit M n=1 Tax=Agrobacterium leguminum TaxID=2792015 RepID=UPI0030CB9799
MTEEQKRQLEQKLWNIANTLRGRMDADEFRDYILGFIFFKYLSEKLLAYANEILSEDGINYVDVPEGEPDGEAILEAVKEETVAHLGYFLRPSELFSEIAKRGAAKGKEGASTFILDDLTRILSNIEQSTMGTASEDDFDKLFEDLDLTSTKLGRTEQAKNEVIVKVLTHLNEIDFELYRSDSDILGDAYEYLIGKFAAGAGKKAGEFYTPREVSTVLARLVTTGKDRLKSVYDPTCGSGSLLLRVAREARNSDSVEFYGQELNRTTYNLARMNMLLHGVHFSRFNILQEDTLEHPQHALEMRFEAVVANPPFSAKWSANVTHESDDRFAQYGRLAPSSKADFAFVQHMLHYLDDNGTMAVILPHGALFRSGAEAHIREYLIREKNWLDAVIGLPANLFYGTSIPTCILVFKKCRENPDDVLFVDASRHFDQQKKQNVLREEDIDEIVETYRSRTKKEHYSRLVSFEEIKKNKFNLNIPRYINAFEQSEPVDISRVVSALSVSKQRFEEIDLRIADYIGQLHLPFPDGVNLDLLRAYKRGIAQKLFAQEVRFARDGGTAFPEWDERQLREIAERRTAKNVDMKLTRVFTNSAVQGVIDQAEYFDKDIANADNLGGYYIIDTGDFVYNPRISVTAPVGPIKQNKIGTGVMSPLYTVFRMQVEHTDFFAQYFDSDFWHDYMKSVANYGARHDRMAIATADFMDMPLPWPDADEQRKIADCLQAIDSKIEAVGSQVTQTGAFKTGATQQIFG